MTSGTSDLQNYHLKKSGGKTQRDKNKQKYKIIHFWGYSTRLIQKEKPPTHTHTPILFCWSQISFRIGIVDFLSPPANLIDPNIPELSLPPASIHTTFSLFLSFSPIFNGCMLTAHYMEVNWKLGGWFVVIRCIFLKSLSTTPSISICREEAFKKEMGNYRLSCILLLHSISIDWKQKKYEPYPLKYKQQQKLHARTIGNYSNMQKQREMIEREIYRNRQREKRKRALREIWESIYN